MDRINGQFSPNSMNRSVIKRLRRFLFYFLCVIAAIITCIVLYLYTFGG